MISIYYVVPVRFERMNSMPSRIYLCINAYFSSLFYFNHVIRLSVDQLFLTNKLESLNLKYESRFSALKSNRNVGTAFSVFCKNKVTVNYVVCVYQNSPKHFSLMSINSASPKIVLQTVVVQVYKKYDIFIQN